jgi:hypothetical protein
MVLHEQWAEDLLSRLQAVEPVRPSPSAHVKSTRRVLSGRAFVVAFAVIVLLCTGVAYGVSEWVLPPPPPAGWENDPRYIGLPPDELAVQTEQAIRAAEKATPLPPGASYERPTSADLQGFDPAGAASVVLIRRGCAWKADLIQAREANDVARMERDIAVLVEPIWLRYHAAEQKGEVAAIERARYRGVLAGTETDVGMLRQDYGINCDGSISPTLSGGG